MVRNILGVIVGYIVMSVFVFVTFTGAYLILGADRSFKPGSYDASNLWLIVSFALGLSAAVLGGIVCRLIAQTITPVYVLVGLVIVLSIVLAIGPLTADDVEPAPRAGDVSNMEAMTKARTPTIAYIVNPVIMAVGVVAGGLIIDHRKQEAVA